MKKLIVFCGLLSLMVSCKQHFDNPTLVPPRSSSAPYFDTSEYFKLKLVKKALEFKTSACGRESVYGAKDYTKLLLDNSGFTHPSVVYTPNGIDGYNYWCALTPYFGVVLAQSDYTAFENPHIFRSQDGVIWEEPASNVNPIDVAYTGPAISYWSDTELQIDDQDSLRLYYRGNGFPKGFYGNKNLNYRAIVQRASSDGITWTDRKLLYSTNAKGVDDNSNLVSPTVVHDNDTWYCYDIQYSTDKHPITPQGNQSLGFVIRRSDNKPDGSFGDYTADKVCQFSSRPWGDGNDPWHIYACKYKKEVYMLICAGLKGKANGESLYIAHSKDGKNFDVVPTPLFAKNCYRSCMLPVLDGKDRVTFRIYQSDKTKGEINLYELELNKQLNNIE